MFDYQRVHLSVFLFYVGYPAYKAGESWLVLNQQVIWVVAAWKTTPPWANMSKFNCLRFLCCCACVDCRQLGNMLKHISYVTSSQLFLYSDELLTRGKTDLKSLCISLYAIRRFWWSTAYNFYASAVKKSLDRSRQDVSTLWLFNIAMENGPFIDGLPIKNGAFPWQTVK